MKISEFAKAAGFSPDTLRYYERISLLQPQRVNNQRVYDSDDLYRARVIKFLREFGFTLQEIKEGLQIDYLMHEGIKTGSIPKPVLEQAHAMVKQKRREIEKREQSLREAKDFLAHIEAKIKEVSNVSTKKKGEN